MPDIITGREFTAFQETYRENHRALTELLKDTALSLKEGQQSISKRVDEVSDQVREINGTVRANSQRVVKLEAGMETAVGVQLDLRRVIDETRSEVHQIHIGGCAQVDSHKETLEKLDDLAGLMVPTARQRLTTGQKVGIGAAGTGVGLAGLWELIHHWSDIVQAWVQRGGK